MKFDLGETEKEMFDRISKWNWWFAWYPIRISSHDWRWLEYVQRCGNVEYTGLVRWNYRKKEPNESN